MLGFININKPVGPTSHDVVASLREALWEQRVGHCGTLDPMACGVLVVSVGKATRLSAYVAKHDKDYRFQIAFGAATTTCDAEGEITAQDPCAHLTGEMVEKALGEFRGSIWQTPPMTSAIHHKGRRLHELARAGREVPRQPRQVSIYRLELTGFSAGEAPRADIEVTCGSGTYVRALTSDIAASLQVPGHVSRLERTRVGPFTIRDSVVTADVCSAARTGALGRMLIRPSADSLLLPRVRLRPDQVDRLGCGHEVTLSHVGEATGHAQCLVDEEGLLAVCGLERGEANFWRVQPRCIVRAEGRHFAAGPSALRPGSHDL